VPCTRNPQPRLSGARELIGKCPAPAGPITGLLAEAGRLAGQHAPARAPRPRAGAPPRADGPGGREAGILGPRAAGRAGREIAAIRAAGVRTGERHPQNACRKADARQHRRPPHGHPAGGLDRRDRRTQPPGSGPVRRFPRRGPDSAPGAGNDVSAGAR